VESLLKITYPNYEIVIVDNESSGKLCYHDKRIKVHNVRCNLGFSIANNLGVHYAHGDLVLILNNDTTVDPSFLEPLVDELKDDVGITTPMIFYPDGKLAYAGGKLNNYGTHHIGHGMEKPHFTLMTNREVDYATGCCLLMKRKFFKDIGGFDEYIFIYLEDVDLSMRVRYHGFRILCIPTSKIMHHEGMSTKHRNSRFFRKLGEHHILYIAKKHGLLNGEYIIRDVAHAAKVIGESILGYNFSEAYGVIEGKIDYLRNWPR
jgi:GT2 family glycosyltransferase